MVKGSYPGIIGDAPYLSIMGPLQLDPLSIMGIRQISPASYGPSNGSDSYRRDPASRQSLNQCDRAASYA
jgi:hypothetical protein